MSELEDVQTTVAVIDGLRSRIAELEAENERLTLAQPLYSRRQLESRLEQAEAALERLTWMVRSLPFEQEADLARRWAERGTK